MRVRMQGLGAAFLALSLVLSACGGDDAATEDDAAAVEDGAVEDEDGSESMDDSEEMDEGGESEDDASMDDEEADEDGDEADEDESGLPSATFLATDFGFEGPKSLPAGMTEIIVENAGAELHHIQLARLEEGMTVDDLMTAIEEAEPGERPDFVTWVGGPNAAMPGDSTNAYVDLEPGEYALLCEIPSPDGVMHHDKGMVASLTVTEAEDDAEAAMAPEADLTVGGGDFSFTLPEGGIPAGDHVIEFVNEGEQLHEIVVVKLEEGATAEDFTAAFAPDAPPGPPPGAGVGGTVGIEPGASQSFAASFEPGNYAFLCFFTDPASQAPHFALGMSSEFTIE